MNTLTLDDIDVANKKVLMRVDFNVPLDKAGNITDDTRISAALPSIQKILSQNGKLILMSHLGRPKGKMAELSLRPCAERLSLLLKRPVLMAKDCIGPEVAAQVAAMKPGDVLLLENVRFYDAEEKPEKDPSFAEQLAKLGDVYVNDAFGTAHRAHSSTTTIAKFFPNRAAAGYLLEKEIAFLGDHILHPQHPFFAIIGGAKVSTKIGVIRSLLAKCDALFLGGAMAYVFLKAQGISIGDSPCEETMLETAQSIIKECNERKVALFLPQDIVAANAFSNEADSKMFFCQEGIPPGFQGMDIGEKTIRQWSEELKRAKIILWNGPVGVFEFPNFAKGTHAIARVLSTLKETTTIIGGGDSVAAVQEAGLGSAMSHVSTGGGASLEYVEFGTLPGIEALSPKKS